jgi:hypothetical protein
VFTVRKEAAMATDGPYVLVVDDDPDIVDSMRFVL